MTREGGVGEVEPPVIAEVEVDDALTSGFVDDMMASMVKAETLGISISGANWR